jgi:hypothetical protein
MPCYTIRQTPVTFEKVAYKVGHLSLLTGALKQMDYQVQASGMALRIWPVGATATVENTILYRDGRFQIPSPLKDRFTLEAIQQAYAREAVKLHARRNGWLLREISLTEFEVTRR